ncbi:MAG: hypothetical protein BZY80_05630 [SAR202 cluster bacterium Io17-Chloro-G2]|nr:MAG: hypothetical protein BZY80_05630 [SAR202 cluster bacterium Io17-Chloro-G2]
MGSRKYGVIDSVNDRVYLGVALAMLFMVAACGQGAARPQADSPSEASAPFKETQEARPAEGLTTQQPPSSLEQVPAFKDPAPPNWRYVNSGWVEPEDAGSATAFSQELMAFVITNQRELDAFNAGFTARLTRGTSVSLARIEFEDSILLAAYYLWRPVQGDPLSVVGFAVTGNLATVELELEDQPQGRLRPYLLAPMRVVALSKDLFPAGEMVEFVFKLNGEPAATVSAAID